MIKNELIEKLMNTEGNVSIKKGMITFEDGEIIDIQKAMKEISFTLHDWRIEECLGSDPYSGELEHIPDSMQRPGEVTITKDGYGFNIQTKSPLGHASIIAFEYNLGQLSTILNLPDQEDHSFPSYDYSVLIKSSEDGAIIMDGVGGKYQIIKNGSFKEMQYGSVPSEEEIIEQVVKKELTAILENRLSFEALSKSNQLLIILHAIQHHDHDHDQENNDRLAKWIDHYHDLYHDRCCIMNALVEKGLFEIAEYCARSPFSWDNKSAQERADENPKFKAFRDAMRMKHAQDHDFIESPKIKRISKI